jgi:hypothetical protein
MSDDQTRLPEELFAGLPEERTATRGEEDEGRQAVEPPPPAEAPAEADLGPRLTGRRRGRRGGKRLVLPKEQGARNFSPQQRLLILDT